MQTDSYLNSDKLPIDFVDTFDAENNIKAYCKVSPKWIETADRDTKLEKIITQKWLAIFPEGCEAWAEQRRTGYPRLFPVRFNHSKDGCVYTGNHDSPFKLSRRIGNPKSGAIPCIW